MGMIFHSHVSKTHFHKNGCALGLMMSCYRKGLIAAISPLKFNVNLPKIMNDDLNQCLFCLP